MPAVEGVFKMPFRNWLFPEDYNWAEGSYKVADNDREIAVIREYLLGNISDTRLSVQEANAAVSIVQAFDYAATAIRDKLILMEEVADEAVNGYHTDAERASMQKQLEELAKDINATVAGTEYDGNKLFTAQGHVISIPINKRRSIHLFAKDLTFRIENVSLTEDAKGAFTNIRKALKETGEYVDYLKGKNRLLQDSMATIEEQIASAAGIEPGGFETEVMQQLAVYLSARISDDAETFSQIQSNITPHEALKKLTYSS